MTIAGCRDSAFDDRFSSDGDVDMARPPAAMAHTAKNKGAIILAGRNPRRVTFRKG